MGKFLTKRMGLLLLSILALGTVTVQAEDNTKGTGKSALLRTQAKELYYSHENRDLETLKNTPKEKLTTSTLQQMREDKEKHLAEVVDLCQKSLENASDSADEARAMYLMSCMYGAMKDPEKKKLSEGLAMQAYEKNPQVATAEAIGTGSELTSNSLGNVRARLEIGKNVADSVATTFAKLPKDVQNDPKHQKMMEDIKAESTKRQVLMDQLKQHAESSRQMATTGQIDADVKQGVNEIEKGIVK